MNREDLMRQSSHRSDEELRATVRHLTARLAELEEEGAAPEGIEQVRDELEAARFVLADRGTPGE